MNPTPEPRIGDAERDAAIRALGEHYAAGRLTKEEYDERSDIALRARTNSDLRPLFVDLPSAHAQYAGVSAGPAHGVRSPRDRRPAPAAWTALPLLPLLVCFLVLATLVSGAWWLLFVIGWFVWWGPRRYHRYWRR